MVGLEDLRHEACSAVGRNFFRTYQELCHTTQTFTIADLPRKNSTAERYHQALGTILTTLTCGAVHQWDQVLTEAAFATKFDSGAGEKALFL